MSAATSDGKEAATLVVRTLSLETDAQALVACAESLCRLGQSKPFVAGLAELEAAPLLVGLLGSASAAVRGSAVGATRFEEFAEQRPARLQGGTWRWLARRSSDHAHPFQR